jgi:hypothetical protein
MRSSTALVGALTICAATLCAAQERDPETACLAPKPLKDALECAQSIAKYPGKLETIKEDPAGARLVRMRTGKGHDVILLESSGAEKWSAHPIYYEQAHGKRESHFELVALGKVTIGARTAWRVDYKAESEIVARREERRGVHEKTALCSPLSPQGCVQVVSSCIVARTVDDETKIESFKGTLVISPEGVVSVKSEQRVPGTVCKPSQPVRIWTSTTPPIRIVPDRRVPTPQPDVPR